MMNRIYSVLATWLFLASISSTVTAKVIYEESTEKIDIQVELITENLGVPWGMDFLDPDTIIFTERSGGIGMLTISTGKVTKIQNPPQVMARGQGGLLDVVVSPDYPTSGWIYFTYVKEKDGRGVTVLARAKINGNKIDLWQDVFETLSATKTGRHFGSRIAFDHNGHVFFTVGDRGERPTSQDLTNHAGTVLRLTMEGEIPKDNPFMNDKSVLDAIWSYGHRNIQGIVYDKDHDRLWTNEHGPRGGDEINLVHAGKNYGWPQISYGKEYWGPKSVGQGTHKKGMEQPKKVYTPSIAPSSLMLYTGKEFPAWNGNLFSGALKLTHLNRVTVDSKGELNGEERLLEDFAERIRALKQGPDGFIYFSTDSGQILRIKPAK